LVNFVVRIYFQAKSRGGQRAFVRNQMAAVLGFRILAIVYLLLLIYPLTSWSDFAHVGLPTWVRWTFGVILLVLYLGLFSWSHIALGRHWSGILEIHKDHELVKSGPYRLVRHPMYSTFFLWSFGIAVLSSNWLIFLVYTVAVIFMYLCRVSSEEEMMVEKFGDAYKEYMIQTGRLLPRFRVGNQSK
jgi:protein-S-isoprenylcysteine O-methyltransferase Ste14